MIGKIFVLATNKHASSFIGLLRAVGGNSRSSQKDCLKFTAIIKRKITGNRHGIVLVRTRPRNGTNKTQGQGTSIKWFECYVAAFSSIL